MSYALGTQIYKANFNFCYKSKINTIRDFKYILILSKIFNNMIRTYVGNFKYFNQ